MQSIPATDARANFADLLRRVTVAKERIVIERRGRPAVAMVPVEDLEAIDGFAANDLRAREGALAQAQRIARIGSWRWSIERNELISCSPEYARIHGVAPDEIHALMAEQLERVIHPDDRARVAETFRRVDQEGRDYEIEYRIVRPNGDIRHVLEIGEVVVGATGRPVEQVGTVQDITELERVQEALRESEQRLDFIAENSNVAIFISRISDGAFKYFNTATAEIFGLPVEELAGRSTREFYHDPRDRRLLLKELEEKDAVRNFELKVKRADGSTVWVLDSVTRTKFQGEDALLSTIVDITERKQAEETLKRAHDELERRVEERTRELHASNRALEDEIAERQQSEEALQHSESMLAGTLDIMLEAVISVDGQQRIQLFNKGAETVFGYSSEEIIGQPLERLLPVRFRDTHHRHVQEFERSPAVTRLMLRRGEIHGLRSNGAEFPAEASVSKFETSGATRFTVVLRDITERRQAEAALRESNARLRDAIESISEGFILYDADDRLVLCNSKYRDFYPSIVDMLKPGAKLEDLARTAFEAGAVQGSAQDVETWMEMRLKQHRTGQGTHEQHLKDGRWLLCSERKTSGGGTVGIRTDITERRRAEEQLRQAQKMEAVGQLTGGVAHDFNNLLTIIIGNLDMLDDHLGDDSTAKSFAQSALKATFRGAELTQQLLAFSRKQNLVPKLTDANALVSSMTELMRRSLTENVEIETVLAGGLWKIVVDQGQLENALLNLAINARDAMPEGGKLTLKTANRHLDADDLDTPAEAGPGPYVLISLSDTGTGMAPEVVERVFEPFFTTKGVGEGSGLGLSMVYGFIKQSGGHIAIHSEVGRGTTITLYLPRAAALDEEAAAAERKPKALPRGEETVLVVEDDPDVRAFVTNALESMGYSVLESENGPSVLLLVDDMPDIDLLFSDVVLPGGMNGLQIAEEIRKLRPRIKVLFTSGYAESAIVHHGRLDEGVELLAKPFTREALARRVRKVLDAAGDR